MVQQIEISKLYPHPDNPRKNVGDVTELANSLKQNGVYQNLTVIAGGKGVPEGAEGYTVIIGHRRLAAAKQAGLTALPCSIAEMSETKQVETMLLENMQRSDLTVYEQAQGFQMLIDLGETQQSIAEKTGFSPATVSRRIKLLQIRSAAFEKTQGKNISMEDYLRIAELKSKSAQKEALEAAGSNNFNYCMKRLMDEQVANEIKPKMRKEFESIGAVEIKNQSDTWNGTYSYEKSVNYEEYTEGKLITAKMKKEKALYFYFNSTYVTIYTKRAKESADSKISPQELAARRQRRELSKITKRMYELREDFIRNFSAAKKYEDVIFEWFLYLALNGSDISAHTVNGKFLMSIIGQTENTYSVDKKLYDAFLKEQPNRAPAIIAWCMTMDNNEKGFYHANWGSQMPSYDKNESLRMIYDFLCRLGYEMSDEELQLQNGTHPLFKGEEK